MTRFTSGSGVSAKPRNAIPGFGLRTLTSSHRLAYVRVTVRPARYSLVPPSLSLIRTPTWRSPRLSGSGQVKLADSPLIVVGVL